MFYDFLVAFYDMNQTWPDYYWQARRVLHTTERGNEPFVRLVAGGAGSASEFFDQRPGLGPAFIELSDEVATRGDDTTAAIDRRADAVDGLPEAIEAAGGMDLAAMTRDRLREGRALIDGPEAAAETPLFDGGLVPSDDQLHWQPVGDAAATRPPL